MKKRTLLVAGAFGVLLVGIAVPAVAITPSCPSGFYRSAGGLMSPSETGPIPNQGPCTSYATHKAPSSGVTIPRYAAGLDSHLAERLAIGVASLLLAVGLAAVAFAQDRHAGGQVSTPPVSA